jgi:ankyrin repeat protein
MKQMMQKEAADQSTLAELIFAIEAGNQDDVKRLAAEHCMLLASGQAHAESSHVPLQYAVSIGDQAACEALLDAGAPLEKQDGKGRTPLMVHSRLPEMHVL